MFIKVEDANGRFRFVNILCVEQMFARTTFDNNKQTWNAVVTLQNDSDWYYLARNLNSEEVALHVIETRLYGKFI